MRPVLFWIPFVHLPIYSYGVMLGISLIIGWYIVLGLCERDGMNREQMGTLYVWTAVCSVAGSRLLYVFTNWERFDSFFDLFKVWQGGLVAYGGFLGGFLTGVIYCYVKKIRLLAWADCVVPSLGTGLAFTRIGCFMFGCDFGKVMEPVKWWSVQFPKDSPAWAEQVKHGLLAANEVKSLPVHPTQIYEMLVGLTLFGVTMLVRRYRTFSGQMFIAFTMAYAVLRFYLETLRADEQRGGIGILSTSQIIGIVTFLAAGALYFVLRSYQKSHPGSLRYWEAAPVEVAAGGGRRSGRRRVSVERTRRGLLKAATGALGALLGAVVGVPIVALIAHPLRATSGGAAEALPVAEVARLPEGVPVRAQVVAASVRDAWTRFEKVALGAVWLIRRGEKVSALSTTCPHAGCFVDFEAAKSCFGCPCHGSAFDLDGKCTSGPSPRGMDSLETEVRGGKVLVKFQRFRQARSDKEAI